MKERSVTSTQWLWCLRYLLDVVQFWSSQIPLYLKIIFILSSLLPLRKDLKPSHYSPPSHLQCHSAVWPRSPYCLTSNLSNVLTPYPHENGKKECCHVVKQMGILQQNTQEQVSTRTVFSMTRNEKQLEKQVQTSEDWQVVFSLQYSQSRSQRGHMMISPPIAGSQISLLRRKPLHSTCFDTILTGAIWNSFKKNNQHLKKR